RQNDRDPRKEARNREPGSRPRTRGSCNSSRSRRDRRAAGGATLLGARPRDRYRSWVSRRSNEALFRSRTGRADGHQNLADTGRENVRGDIRLFADDEVRILARRLKKLMMHRPDGVVVLPDNPVERAAALTDVAMQAANEADVRFDVQVNFDVEEIAQIRVPE